MTLEFLVWPTRFSRRGERLDKSWGTVGGALAIDASQSTGLE
jgi:hypothetical protein